jgi:hypothetical protein
MLRIFLGQLLRAGGGDEDEAFIRGRGESGPALACWSGLRYSHPQLVLRCFRDAGQAVDKVLESEVLIGPRERHAASQRGISM